MPYTGNSGVAYAARNSATDQWVGQVGQAFLNIARAQLPPGVARQPDIAQALANDKVTSTNQALAAQVDGDPVQLAAKQAAAAKLAAQLDEALWSNNAASIQALLQELAQHQNDPAYNSAFFKQFGPTDTLYLAYELGTNSKVSGGNDNNLKILDQALASATNSADWDPSFDQSLFTTVNGGVLPYGDRYLLKYGVYSESFLFTAGDAELHLNPDQQPNSSTDVAVTLEALARNPQAALDFLTTAPASWPVGTRLSQLIDRYEHQDLELGAGDPVVKALGDLLRAAGRRRTPGR